MKIGEVTSDYLSRKHGIALTIFFKKGKLKVRSGGGKAKGSSWERDVGKLLSLWLTNSERPDIFSRNVLSGGSFTLAEMAGVKSSRMAGDLMAAHPLAFRFLEHFQVECKHLADIGLEAYLFDPRGMTALGRIISLAKRQARHIGAEYMLVAKQNHKDALVMVPGEVGWRMLNCLKSRGARNALRPMHHFLHQDQVCVLRLCDMISRIDPDLFLGAKK